LPVNLYLMKTNIAFNLCLAFSIAITTLLSSVSVFGQNPCGNFAGNPQPEQLLCSGTPAVGPTIGAIMAPGAKLKYYLHSGNIANFIDSNFNGIFSNTGSYPPNIQLYISAAVGPGTNSPDLSDPCTDIQSPGSPVVFLEPVTIENQYTCNDNSVDVMYKIEGGYPAYSSSLYSVQGSTTNSVGIGVNNSFTLQSLSGTYILFVEDENGCDASTSEEYQCGTVDLALIKRLADGQSSILNPGDNVTFTFEITIQGDIPVAQVALADYLPNGLVLNDSNWNQPIQGIATVTLNPPSTSPEFISGGTYLFNITLKVASTVSTNTITNSAEIHFIRFIADGENIYSDEDSTFDLDMGNDGTPINDEINDPADQDDHDIETITIITCGGTAGFMPTDTIFSCSYDSAMAIENGTILDAGNVGMYILHTSSTNIIGSIEDSNNTGTFSNPNNDCSLFYISYVFGPDNGDGTPDLDDECTIVLPGTPVVWASPIIINASENCNADQMYFVRYDISGGFAACENSTYDVYGDVNSVAALPGENIINSNSFANNSSYTIIVTDSKGCEAAVTNGPVFCEDTNPCDNNAGTMPNETLYGCAGATLSATETDSQLSSSDVDMYILHDSSTSVTGNIISSNNTGVFNDPQTSCTMLYISYVFGPDDGSGKPELNNDCTKVLPGTPAVWASPISIISNIICDETSETFNYDYTVTGGFALCTSGTYTMSGDVNLNTANENTTYTNSTVFNSGDTYTITATDEQNCIFTFTSNPVVCESQNTCNNEAGSMPTAQIEACANTDISTIETGSILDANDIGIYYLHDSATGLGNIIASNASGSFADPGTYCATLHISYVFGPDEDGDNLPDTENDCTKILNGTPVLWVPEVALTSIAQCDTENNQYFISYTIAGGKASCDANETFSISGTVMESNINAGSYTNPEAIAGSTSYQITVEDDLGCSASYSSNEPIDCLNNLPFCGNTQGEMQAADNPNACANSDITAVEMGTVLQNDFIGQYYLHTGSGTSLGNVISSNNTGTFADPNMPCSTLYISYVFGLDDGNGNISIEDDCTFVLKGTPVVWGEPLSLNTIENCDQNTGTYTVNLTIGGGFAACDSTIDYNVSGDIALNGISAGTYTSTNSFSGGESYTITLEDGNNCINTFTSELVSCERVCGNSSGTPNAAQILCENNMANGSVNDVVVSPGADLVYVLHSGVNMLDTIYAVNNSGTFLNDGTYPVNRQLYISAVIGTVANNDSVPDVSDICTVAALPGTPVVFLTDVSITTEIMCNENTGIATIEYIANGGHPAFDNSLSYTITGDDSTTAPFGETKTFTDNTGSFTLTATDNLGCFNTTSSSTGCTITEMCISKIGTQPSDPFTVCDGDTVKAESIGYFAQDGADLVYVLHDGSMNLGAIIDKNNSGVFNNPGSYPTNTQLYIAAMIGVLNQAGIPDLNDECTIGNFPGTPVTFLDELVVDHSFECKENGGAMVSFTIIGGTGNYSITGSYMGSPAAGETVNFDNPAGNTIYTIEIKDNNNCEQLIEQSYECMINCTNNAGTLSQEDVFLCADATETFSTINTSIQDGYILLYAIHDGQNVLGSVIDFSDDGVILNDGSYAYNTQYYVSPLITTVSAGNPDLDDPCLAVSLPGRPLWFLSPITIDDSIECSETTNAYTVSFSVTGGAPEVDGLINSYDISGVFGGMATLGQIINSPPQVNPDYTIVVVDSNGCETSIFESNVDCNDCPVLSKSSIPNIFSPNNDTANRMWSIPNLQTCYPNNRVIISNRWGSIVWDKENCEDNCWDGTAQNSDKELPTGAYYYVIQLNGNNSVDTEILSGTITLLR